MVKDATINARVTKKQKEIIKAILKRLNSEKLDYESEKNLSYPYIYFILTNKENPDLYTYIKYLELKEEVEEHKEDIELLEFKIQKKEEKIKLLEDKLKNASLDSFNKIEEVINEHLLEATVNVIEKAKQRNIYSFENIPEAMFTATAGKGFSAEELKASVKKYYEEH